MGRIPTAVGYSDSNISDSGEAGHDATPVIRTGRSKRGWLGPDISITVRCDGPSKIIVVDEHANSVSWASMEGDSIEPKVQRTKLGVVVFGRRNPG